MDTNMFRLVGFALFCFLTASAQAVETTVSGFAQVTVGRVLSGSPTNSQAGNTTNPYLVSGKPGVNYNCPCFTANYENAGVYESGKTQFAPETLAGVQGNFAFTPEASATVQLVARGVQLFDHGASSTVGLDWAFASYKLDQNLTVQAGRKRLPLYYYSDFMYVGYAYPWIRPPQDLYAWQIYSYDGANLLYTTTAGEWAVTGNVWAGNHTDTDNKLLGALYYSTQIEESWKNMFGAYLDASNDIVTARLVAMSASVERFSVVNDLRTPVMMNGTANNVGQNFYGLTVNADYEGFLFRSEFNYIDRPSVQNNYTAQAYSGGYQFGNHTVMLGWSQFRERAAFWADNTEYHTTNSLTYRWDFAKSQAFKLQYDQIRDDSGAFVGNQAAFTGNAKLISASWQIVF